MVNQRARLRGLATACPNRKRFATKPAADIFANHVQKSLALVELRLGSRNGRWLVSVARDQTLDFLCSQTVRRIQGNPVASASPSRGNTLPCGQANALPYRREQHSSHQQGQCPARAKPRTEHNPRFGSISHSRLCFCAPESGGSAFLPRHHCNLPTLTCVGPNIDLRWPTRQPNTTRTSTLASKPLVLNPIYLRGPKARRG